MAEHELIHVAKRPRTEKDESEGSLFSGIKRSKIWQDDGNIVLEAEKTQFRVHRSMLAEHSKVFSDLLSLPQPEGEMTVEGCPVVSTAFDRASDWENVLDILYFSLQTYPYPESLSFNVLVSMLRLGHKYEMDDFRATALERLKLDVPTTFEGWEYSFTSESPKSGFAAKGNEIDILNLGLELGMQSILPVAYYLCLRNLTVDEMFTGTRRNDGSLATLDRTTLHSLVIGRDELIHLQNVTCFLRKEFPCTVCTNRAQCKSLRVRNLEATMDELRTNISWVLDPWEPKGKTDGFCEECQEFAEENFENSRLDIWKQLPLCFKLPDWDDLKDFEES